MAVWSIYCVLVVTTRNGGQVTKFKDELIEIGRPLDEVIGGAEVPDEEEDEAPARRKPTAAQAKSVAFPADEFHGPWTIGEDGKALVVKTVQFPPEMWAVASDLSILLEMKGAASVIRRAVALYVVDEANRDPRVQAMLRKHAAMRTFGLAEEQ